MPKWLTFRVAFISRVMTKRNAATRRNKPTGKQKRSAARRKPAGKQRKSVFARRKKPAGRQKRSAAARRKKPAGRQKRSAAARRKKRERQQKQNNAAERKNTKELFSNIKRHTKFGNQNVNAFGLREILIYKHGLIMRRKRLRSRLQKREAAIGSIRKLIDEQYARKEQAERILSTLGLFKFGEKKNQKTIIEDAVQKIAETEPMRAQAEQAYLEKIAAGDRTVSTLELSIREEADQLYCLPEEPAKPE